LQAFSIAAQIVPEPLQHDIGCVHGVGERENLVGSGVTFPYQVSDTASEDGRLARARARNN
jgi:hypothetical protein